MDFWTLLIGIVFLFVIGLMTGMLWLVFKGFSIIFKIGYYIIKALFWICMIPVNIARRDT